MEPEARQEEGKEEDVPENVSSDTLGTIWASFAWFPPTNPNGSRPARRSGSGFSQHDALVLAPPPPPVIGLLISTDIF